MPSKGHGCGVNHNGIWAAQGHPVDVVALQGRWTAAGISYRGSDASGIVVAIGENVTDVQIGDEVVMHCGWWDEDAVDDQIMDRSAKIWGYEVNFGAFAEYTRVKQTALLPKPKHLSWEEAASYMLCGATAYRMLYGFAPHTLKPGTWFSSGAVAGMGAIATQLVRAAGGIAIVVVSSEEKLRTAWRTARTERSIAATTSTGALDDLQDGVLYHDWMMEARRFQKKYGAWWVHVKPIDRDRTSRRRYVPNIKFRLRTRRHGGDMWRHQWLQGHVRYPIPVDEAKATSRFALCQQKTVRGIQRTG